MSQKNKNKVWSFEHGNGKRPWRRGPGLHERFEQSNRDPAELDNKFGMEFEEMERLHGESTAGFTLGAYRHVCRESYKIHLSSSGNDASMERRSNWMKVLARSACWWLQRAQ